MVRLVRKQQQKKRLPPMSGQWIQERESSPRTQGSHRDENQETGGGSVVSNMLPGGEEGAVLHHGAFPLLLHHNPGAVPQKHPSCLSLSPAIFPWKSEAQPSEATAGHKATGRQATRQQHDRMIRATWQPRGSHSHRPLSVTGGLPTSREAQQLHPLQCKTERKQLRYLDETEHKALPRLILYL